MARTRVLTRRAPAERSPVALLGTLAVLITLTILTGATTPFVRSAAAAPAPRHIAVIVAGVSSGCVSWTSGLTAADAVARIAEPTVRKSRVIQLSGRPSTAKMHPDGAWAYWRVIDGRWKRASVSPTETEPSVGGVDGWTYSTRGAAATKPPTQSATKVYASMCAASDKTAGGGRSSDGNDLTNIVPASNPTPPKASGHSAGGKTAHAPRPGSGSRAATRSAESAPSSARSNGSSRKSSAASSASASGSGAMAPSDDASASAAKSSGSTKKSGASTAAASPVAADKDAGGPGLGLATGALLLLLVGGGTALYVVRRRLTGGAKS